MENRHQLIELRRGVALTSFAIAGLVAERIRSVVNGATMLILLLAHLEAVICILLRDLSPAIEKAMNEATHRQS